MLADWFLLVNRLGKKEHAMSVIISCGLMMRVPSWWFDKNIESLREEKENDLERFEERERERRGLRERMSENISGSERERFVIDI